MKEALFAMAFHCYQPVDNFDWAVEKAYERSYMPLLETIESFPAVKASFHFSGNLLEWMSHRHPRYLDRMKKLMDKGQIELVGGGYFEPIMALIPERDREGQIRMNQEIFSRLFNVTPRGAWIAERVWTPDLADTLSSMGIEYTILDDYHLFQAGVEAEDIFAPYDTEGKLGHVMLFPALTRLRYYIPFQPPSATIQYMKKINAESKLPKTCFFFADDGEKFGLWPHTHRWVYQRGWLKEFFGAIEKNSSWLKMATYSEVRDAVSPVKTIDVPESSYPEMMEWSGGAFKNFLKKYPQSDRMHKRMLFVSDKVEEMSARANDAESADKIADARTELYKAQASCAYWHGTFGGLYLPHLRSGIYGHLIKAQSIVDMMHRDGVKRISCIEHDMGPSRRETVLRNKFLDVYVRSADGGALSELDFKPFSANLTNIMSRRREEYHRKLEKGNRSRVSKARKAVIMGDFADIHDVLGVNERGLEKLLCYDHYERACFLTHIFRDDKPWKNMHRGFLSHDRFLKGDYSSDIEHGSDAVTDTLWKREKIYADNSRPFDLEVRKEISLSAAPSVKMRHRVIKRSGGSLQLRYAVEFNFSIKDRDVVAKPRLKETDAFLLKDDYSALTLDFTLNRKFTVFMYPIYTINESESGLGKTLQGISVLIGEKADLDETDSSSEMIIDLRIK